MDHSQRKEVVEACNRLLQQPPDTRHTDCTMSEKLMQSPETKDEKNAETQPASSSSDDAVQRGRSAIKAAEQAHPKEPEQQRKENEEDAEQWRNEG